MKSLIRTQILLGACLLVALLPTSAAVINIADELNATGDGTITTDVSIGGETSLYYVGTMTFDSVDESSSFFSFEARTDEGGSNGSNIIAQWVKRFNGTEVAITAPVNNTLDNASVGYSFTMALKIDQTTGDYTYWLNPNFGASEASNTVTGSGTGASTATVESVQFRWGSGTVGVTDFTDFAVYTGSDTPFAIPEPSALLLSGLGFLLFLRRRRR